MNPAVKRHRKLIRAARGRGWTVPSLKDLSRAERMEMYHFNEDEHYCVNLFLKDTWLEKCRHYWVRYGPWRLFGWGK